MSSGTCIATVLLKDGDMVVSNVGDCRVVMSQNGIANALTTDHLASRDDERERIENTVSSLEIHPDKMRDLDLYIQCRLTYI